MKFSERWLRSYVNPDLSSEALAQALTMAGLEVEERVPAAPPLESIVVAQVRSVARHPNADKLTVCEVDTGQGGALVNIVCGAPNVAVGIKVPCALPGAVLPGGMRIGVARMRGVESQGMLCSARELGLSDDHSGLMVLSSQAPLGALVHQVLGLDDHVWLLKLTPNLAHCMSLQGIAREVAAITGAPLTLPEAMPVPASIPDRLPVRIMAPELCGRFSGRIIRGVDARAATPDWMRERLERSGQRSISALVDISNYVMLELGRPTHVFDLDRIHGELEVRWARDDENLKLLNGQTIELAEAQGLKVGVIADSRQVESLAGIMGGDETAVSLDTRHVYVEAAFWWPAAIAGRARRYNFSTDAAQRFERGVDATTTVDHLEYITNLIVSVCGGEPGPVDDTVTGLPAREPVTMRVARARQVIGAPLTLDECTDVFRRLGLTYRVEVGQQADGSDALIVVTPPARRFDLRIEEDLIEEVVRIWGYERLPLRPPKARATFRPAPEAQTPVIALKRAFAARDYQEVVNFSFVSSRLEAQLGSTRGLETGASAPEAIRLLNPIAETLDVMRTQLWAGLIENLRYNVNRKASRVRIFEFGRVFLRDASLQAGPLQVPGIRQPWRVAALAWGPVAEEQWGCVSRPVDFFDLKADLQAVSHAALRFEPAEHPALHPGQSAAIWGLAGWGQCDGRKEPIGWMGALHPSLVQALDLPSAPILLEVALDTLQARAIPSFSEFSRFPPAVRDLALVVPLEVLAADLLARIEVLRVETPALSALQSVRLFDEYRGKGLENKEKSLAFRFWMQDTQRTLSDAEVDAAMSAVLAGLSLSHGVRLRAS